MQHDHVLKKLILTYLPHPQGWVGVGGGMRAKYMLPRFRIGDSIQFGMQSDHVLEKLNFDLLTPGSGDWGDRGSADKIFATMLLHLCFPLM